MTEVKKGFDDMRLYTVRCPSCRRWIRLPGDTLNRLSDRETFRCFHCGASSKKEKWVNDGSRS